MTQKEALLRSITKYEWFVDHPDALYHPDKKIENCALCVQASEERMKVNMNGEYTCPFCVMHSCWPSPGGVVELCISYDSAWDTWSDSVTFNYRSERLEPITTYDRAFLALLLSEDFQSKLKELECQL